MAVPPDSPWLIANTQAGWPVDSGNKNLKLAADGGDVVYSIAVLGTTTASARVRAVKTPSPACGSGVATISRVAPA